MFAHFASVHVCCSRRNVTAFRFPSTASVSAFLVQAVRVAPLGWFVPCGFSRPPAPSSPLPPIDRRCTVQYLPLSGIDDSTHARGWRLSVCTSLDVDAESCPYTPPLYVLFLLLFQCRSSSPCRYPHLPTLLALSIPSLSYHYMTATYTQWVGNLVSGANGASLAR